MKRILSVPLHPRALVVYGVVALAALVWWIGPMVAFGGKRPLDASWERWAAIAALLLIVAAVFGWRYWRRKRANAAIVKGLSAGPSAADREVEVLNQRFAEALKVLDESARQSGKRSWLQPGRLLYELPWYLFIGAPGSGKTTALLNAGLHFPLAGKMGQASIKGVGGTRNCDWWFTDQAVLIDTAGRYTLQESDERVDATAWENFLALLKKSRPRRPINGVLLTVNVQDLLQQSPADRTEHAAKLRARLQELQARLGVRPPVYVLVTKTDLVAGFNECFEALGKEERDQVWGFSFPYDATGSDNAMTRFDAEFDALEGRLRERLLDRIEQERDVLKRAAIFAFPQQFDGLKPLLGGFLAQVFDGSGALDQRGLLRGVYFTSGTQEGTPIDRVLGTLARTFGVDPRAAAATASPQGKSFFLSRLLKDLVFAEQGLVGEDRQAEARRRQVRLAAVGAMGLASLALLVGWAISYSRNAAYVSQVEARLPEVQKAVDGLPPAGGSSDIAALPQVLDLLTAAAQPQGFPLKDPPLLNGLGLYQGDKLAAGADIGYQHLLDRALMPRVTYRLEERLRAVNRDNLELAYTALKSYVMLYSPEHFDADTLKAWVTIDWDQNLAGTLSPEQREALAGHLDAALAHGAPMMALPMDKNLVASVREMLVAYPLEYRVFSQLRRTKVASSFPEFSVASAAGPNAGQVFERRSGQPITRGISGLFTRDGYHKGFKDAVAKVAKQLAAEEQWVLGTPTAALNTSVAKDAALRVVDGDTEMNQRVRRLYLQEYIKVWDQYLADVKLIKMNGLDGSLQVARLLAAPDSPLKAYLRGVARETTLVQAEAGDIERDTVAGKIRFKAKEAREEMEALVGGATPPEGGEKGAPLEAMVDEHFRQLNSLVTGTPPPIDEVTKLFNDVYVQLTAVVAAKNSKTAPPPGGGGGAAAAKAAAGLQPEPIKSMLTALADAGAGGAVDAERQGLTAELKPIADQCKSTIAGRFPFAQGAKADVLPDDFGQMFGVGGQLDDFYQRRLAAMVDTGANPWSYKPQSDGTKPPGGAALADFQRAARIKEAFFRGGGKVPGFKVDLRVVEMAEGLKEVNLDIDGQVTKFSAGNTAAQTIAWPSSRVASQIKLSGAAGSPPQLFEGPWALFRLFNQFEIQPSPQPERFSVLLNVDGKRARMEVISGSALNPLRLREVQTFRCPESL